MRIIFNGFQNIHTKQVLINLQKSLGFSYCATIDEGDLRVNLGIQVDHHNFWEVLWGKYPSPEHTWKPLDEGLIQSLSSCESYVLRMMDRMDPLHSKSYDFRKNLYLKHLQYWNNFLDSKKITHFIAINVPHEMQDFIIYSLCKHKHITTLIFYQSSVPDASFLINDFMTGPFYLKEKYDQIRRAHGETSPVILQDYLEQHFVEKSDPHLRVAAPFYMAGNRKQILEAHTKKYILFRFLQKLKQYLKDRTTTNISWYDFIKISFKKFIARQRLLKNDRSLWEKYKSLCSDPDYTKPYIYVALHYQPECTTSPMGGVFVDQLLMVKILSASAPSDMLLFIKEHPAQRSQARHESFYSSLLKLPNVQLIDVNIPTTTLITHSRAIATVTGTVGWEGLFFEKPILMFGRFFYQYAPGVYKITSQAECQLAIEQIQTKPSHTLHDLRCFLRAVQETSIKGYVDPAFIKVSNVSETENTNHLTQILLSQLSTQT